MFPENLTIATERLLLTPISMKDLDDVWPHVTDPRICRLMSWLPHQDKSETRAFIDNLEQSRRDERGITWSIFMDGRFCGIISLISIMRQHRALTYDSAELAYWLGVEFQGQRIMSEAGRHVIAFAFKELCIHRLVVEHFTSNPQSEQVIKQWGFHYIGEKRHAFMKEGVWHNAKAYDLLETDQSLSPPLA